MGTRRSRSQHFHIIPQYESHGPVCTRAPSHQGDDRCMGRRPSTAVDARHSGARSSDARVRHEGGAGDGDSVRVRVSKTLSPCRRALSASTASWRRLPPRSSSTAQRHGHTVHACNACDACMHAMHPPDGHTMHACNASSRRPHHACMRAMHPNPCMRRWLSTYSVRTVVARTVGPCGIACALGRPHLSGV